MKIFADDVIGTKFDQKYFQCILSEYLINFESFPPENGIVEVSLRRKKTIFKQSLQQYLQGVSYEIMNMSRGLFMGRNSIRFSDRKPIHYNLRAVNSVVNGDNK